MHELKIISHFDAAHSLRGYDGDCANLHGHTWTVEVLVEGSELNEIGILIDFKDLKKYTKELIKKFDHKYINDLPAFSEGGLNPTAENLSKYIYDELDKSLATDRIGVKAVSVWESATACATYRRK